MHKLNNIVFPVLPTEAAMTVTEEFLGSEFCWRLFQRAFTDKISAQEFCVLIKAGISAEYQHYLDNLKENAQADQGDHEYDAAREALETCAESA